MMEIAYLCKMRAFEVRSLTEFDLLEEGVFVERRKDSMNSFNFHDLKAKGVTDHTDKAKFDRCY